MIMFKARKNGREMVKLMIKMLQRMSLSSLSVLSRRPNLIDEEYLDQAKAETVPEDVKEGHFAVFAVKGEEPKRFVVELGYLTNPAFLMLLEQAEEEYGFKQKGALAIPCRPEELQMILQKRRKKGCTANAAQYWTTYNITIRESC